jgi:hypothetical protein
MKTDRSHSATYKSRRESFNFSNVTNPPPLPTVHTIMAQGPLGEGKKIADNQAHGMTFMLIST